MGNCLEWHALTFEFLVSQHFDAPTMHAFGCFATGAARLDRILVQIVGQPAQIAIADERITCQMPGSQNTNNVSFDIGTKHTDRYNLLTVSECFSLHRMCHWPTIECYCHTMTTD